uniref:RNA-directed DNA polymerase, eukaryota n=1 Tax=Tanacetum cinerariifolium TaxID=118510 RepID=A0A699KPT3_TANCI|nr:RNA-directed DNA polymerase, eukaryota [Tanacetum cinerariifolium]
MVERTWRSFSHSDGNGVVSDVNLLRRLDLNRQLHDINIKEATDSFQKSKVRWAIEEMRIQSLFTEAFHDHFEARFKKTITNRLKLNFPFNKRLLHDQAADLERRVSRDEIRMAVWNCGENKSPGPDGFTFEFFRRYWDFVGPDFCEAVIDAKFVNDYRPISLIGSVYKVVTKILANRLAMVIADIVSDTQSAFIAERQILDGPFILNEVLHWCKRKNKKAMFFKVDFAKVYDSVRWDYLIDVLEAFGFGPTWCKWIRGAFCFAKASVLVNGSPSNEFQFHHRLKQGDPLSPYLFILVMESLHLSFSRAVEEGLFKGICLNKSVSISHLFYADDAMFIGEWSDTNLRGRLTLLKSVLGASPLYTMSIFKVPRGVLKEMEAIRNHFFNGADPLDKKITWVAWDKVLAAKIKRGLGVSSFYALNRALLLK